ncbi:MAG: hypothetical protein IPK72_13375 [Candidatus Eisenbacteria bacterium]|nr:hypothetical protein [Candidatus Eisenbacteria bacterium]
MGRYMVVSSAVTTALGTTPEAVCSALLEGRAGFSPRTVRVGRRASEHLVGELPQTTLEEGLPSQRFRRLPRLDQLVASSAARAWEAVPEPFRSVAPERVGIYFGTARGPIEVSEDLSASLARGATRETDPVKFQETVLNAPVAHLALHYRWRGPCTTFAAGNVSGLVALDAALRSLSLGHVDVAVVGGADVFTDFYLSALDDLRMLSRTAVTRGGPRPLARDRDGTCLGEGAAFLNITRSGAGSGEGHGRRGIQASHLSAVVDSHHGFAMDGAGCASAISGVLQALRSGPEAVHGVYCAATGDEALDGAELAGLSRLFGSRLDDLVLHTPKRWLGDIGAAASLVSLLLALHAPAVGVRRKAPHDGRASMVEAATGSSSGCALTEVVHEAAHGGLHGAVLVAEDLEATS